jgi:hypothetical protein
MRTDIAHGINIGDTVYNCFMEPLIVQEKTVYLVDGPNNSHHIKFIVKDTSNNTHAYSYEDLYLENLEDEDDAEKSWVDWAKNNKDFFDLFDHIETIKEIYRIGFYNGFDHKKQYSYQEMMQK